MEGFGYNERVVALLPHPNPLPQAGEGATATPLLRRAQQLAWVQNPLRIQALF